MTITLNDSEFYDLLSPAHTSGETIDIKNYSILTVRTTNLPIGLLYADNAARGVTVTRGNEQTPIFFKSSGLAQRMQGVMRLDGGLITLGTSNGTGGQTFNLPTDASGEGYEILGGLVVEHNGESEWWGYVDSLNDLFEDNRGKLFTQNTTANTVTFGSGGTQGAIPPSGAVIKCANIQWKANGTAFNLSTGDLITSGAVDINNLNFQNSGRVVSTGWLSFSDPASTVWFRDFNLNSVENLCVSAPSNNNVRLTLANGTYANILFVSDNDVSTEAINDSVTPVNVGTFTWLFLNPKSNYNGRARLNLNGGTIGVANAYCGDDDYSFRAYEGEGTISRLNYSCRSRPSQTGIRGVLYPRGGSSRFEFSSVRKYGTDSHNELHRFMDNGDSNVVIRDLITSSDFICTRFADADFLAKVEMFNCVINGTITDTTTRTLDMTSVLGTKLIDVYFEDTDVDNQTGDFMQWFGVNLNGNIVNLGRGSPLAQTYDNANRLTGYVSTRPSLSNPGATLTSGTESNISDRKEGFYSRSNSEILRWNTGLIKGVTSISSATIDGSTSNSIWTGNFRIRTARGEFSGSSLLFNTSNLQSEFSSLVDYDYEEGFELEMEAQRTGGAPNNALTNMSLAVSYQPGYVFEEPGAVISFTMPNILQNSQYVIWNTTQNSYVSLGNAGTAGVEVSLTEKLDFNEGDSGQVWVTYQSGLTVMKKVRIDFTFGTTDISIPTTQEQLEEFSSANGFVDGSTVTWLGLDPNDPHILQFDASTSNLPQDSNGNAIATKWEMVSWYYYAIAHIPDGILLFFDEMDIIDGSNVRLNNGVKLDNIGDRQIYFTDRDKNLFTADGSSWTLGQMTGNYGIVSENKIPSTIVVTSPLSSSQEANIALISEIDSLIEQRLDVAVSTRADQTSVNNIPTSPLLSNDSRLDNLDAPVSGVSISEQDKNDIATKVWDEEL